MKISISKILDTFLCIILIVITDMTFSYYNSKDLSMYEWQRNVSILTFVFIIIALLIIKKTYSLLSLPVLFVALSYLFNFGQVIINGMLSEYQYSVQGNFIPQYTSDVAKQAIYYAFLTIQFVVIGIIVGRKTNGYSVCIDNFTQNVECKRIAKVILCLSLPFKIGLTIVGTVLAYVYGYASASGISLVNIKGYGIMQTFANFYVIGIFFLLCYYRNHSYRFQEVYIVACIISAFSMLSGSRSKGVLDILCFTSFYFLLSTRLNNKRILKVVIVCLITGVMALVIVETRSQSGGVGISAILKHMVKMIKSNKILGNILEEFGGTISSVLKVVEQENVYYTHQNGISYIKGIISVVPNLGYDTSSLMYTKSLYQNQAMGGSYIGEFYFNFGKKSYILGIFIGYFVVTVFDSFICNIRSNKYIKAAYYVPIIYCFLFLPRDYLPMIYRSVVWGIMIIYLVHKSRTIYRKE